MVSVEFELRELLSADSRLMIILRDHLPKRDSGREAAERPRPGARKEKDWD